MTVARVGGRLLLIDASARLLLIHERLEHGGTHWLTPGGGVEDGEHPREAAVREAVEEVGIPVTLPADARPVLRTRRLWSWAGVEYDQVDHFFVARVPDGTVASPAALTDVERQTLIEMRWWTASELAGTTATLVPANLADVLTGILADGR